MVTIQRTKINLLMLVWNCHKSAIANPCKTEKHNQLARYFLADKLSIKLEVSRGYHERL